MRAIWSTELATASPSSGGQGAGERGARNAARFGYRLSVLGYQLSDYEHEHEHEQEQELELGSVF
jgi:hypothetical protein